MGCKRFEEEPSFPFEITILLRHRDLYLYLQKIVVFVNSWDRKMGGDVKWHVFMILPWNSREEAWKRLQIGMQRRK